MDRGRSINKGCCDDGYFIGRLLFDDGYLKVGWFEDCFGCKVYNNYCDNILICMIYLFLFLCFTIPWFILWLILALFNLVTLRLCYNILLSVNLQQLSSSI